MSIVVPGYGVPIRRIYAYSVVGREGLIKVGETTRESARQRIKEQLGTAFPNLDGVTIWFDEPARRYDGTEFRDRDVHASLRSAGARNAGGEWFRTTPQSVRDAIETVKRDRNHGQSPGARPRPDGAPGWSSSSTRTAARSNRGSAPLTVAGLLALPARALKVRPWWLGLVLAMLAVGALVMVSPIIVLVIGYKHAKRFHDDGRTWHAIGVAVAAVVVAVLLGIWVVGTIADDRRSDDPASAERNDAPVSLR